MHSVLTAQFHADRTRRAHRTADAAALDHLRATRPLAPPTRRMTTERPPRPGAVEAEKLQREDDYRLSMWQVSRSDGHGTDE